MRISDWSSDVCSSDLEHRFELRLAEQRGTCRRQQRGHPIILAVFIEIAAPLIIPWLDGIVAEHEDQQEPLVADIGYRFICAQQLGEEGKQERRRVGWGKSVSERVDAGVRGYIKKKKK